MNSMVSKNYLLGTQISFLIITFVIGIIAVTVQNDIWPFLQTNLTIKENTHTWSLLSVLFGFLLPFIWLVKDWSKKAIRYSLLSILIMQLLQMITEISVTKYFFISMGIPTAILYVGYRIIQFISLQRVLLTTIYTSKFSKLFRELIWGTNLLFWLALWIKLTFFMFPQIIYQIF